MALYNFVNLLFQALYLALMVRIFLSWIPHDPYHPAIQFLYQITEPILRPFRNIFPASIGIDFSPILAFVVLGIVQRLVMQILF